MRGIKKDPTLEIVPDKCKKDFEIKLDNNRSVKFDHKQGKLFDQNGKEVGLKGKDGKLKFDTGNLYKDSKVQSQSKEGTLSKNNGGNLTAVQKRSKGEKPIEKASQSATKASKTAEGSNNTAKTIKQTVQGVMQPSIIQSLTTPPVAEQKTKIQTQR